MTLLSLLIMLFIKVLPYQLVTMTTKNDLSLSIKFKKKPIIILKLRKFGENQLKHF